MKKNLSAVQKTATILCFSATLLVCLALLSGCGRLRTPWSRIDPNAKNDKNAVTFSVADRGEKRVLTYVSAPRATEITIPDGIEEIADGALDCPYVETLHIPKSVVYLDRKSSLYHLKKVRFAGDANDWCQIPYACRILKENTALYFGDTAAGSTFFIDRAEKIAPGAFANYKKITGVTLSESVRFVGESAFSGCADLTELVILGEDASSAPLRIGKSAFSGCTGLTAGGCNLRRAVSVGAQTFQNCTSLAGVRLSDETTEIEPDTFSGCTALKTVTFPENLQTVGKQAFLGCESLQISALPQNLKTVEAYAFSGCKSLKTAPLPPALQLLGVGAFANCSTLSEAVLPDGLSELLNQTFFGCTALEKVSFGKNLKRVGDGAFEDCTSLSAATLPEGTLILCHAAFRNCSALAAVTLPETLAVLENGVFANCASLTEIALPLALSRVESGLFSGCEKLRSVRYAGTLSSWEAVKKSPYWNRGGAFTAVSCTDGNAEILPAQSGRTAEIVPQ